MKLTECSPTVRYAHRILRTFDYQKFLLAHDHRLFFVCSGELKIAFEEKEYTLNKNSLIIFPPATPYKLFATAQTELMLMNFDLDENEVQNTRPPVEVQFFKRENVFSALTLPPFEDVFVLRDAFSEKERLVEICDEFLRGGKYRDSITSSLMKATLLRCASKSEREAVKENASPLAKKIKAYVDNLDKNANPTNTEIAKHFSYHENYVNNTFRRAFGISLHSYLMKRKIDYAKELLLSTDMQVSEIASLCGFSGVSYFCEYFHRETGMRPSDFRTTV